MSAKLTSSTRTILRNFGLTQVSIYKYKDVLNIFYDSNINEKDVAICLVDLPCVYINGKFYSNQKEPP